ncbi:hypothetical protein AAG906_027286 [Vitis piasezkii]
MHPHPSLCTLDYPRVLRDGRAFTIKKPHREREEVHVFHSYTWVHLWTFRAALVTIGSGYPFLSLLLVVSILVGEFTVTSLDSPSWIRVGGRLTRASDQLDRRSIGDMDSRYRPVPIRGGYRFDTTVPPPPPHSRPQTIPFTRIVGEVAPPPAVVPTPISEDPHARMDKLERS